jgi:hypothetical protein
MPGVPPALTAHLDALIAFFNRRSLDLPDGLFDRRTQFVLNGVPFEETLGQNPSDPLVLMIARGPAGYRFTLKALQHALPDARVERGELTSTEGAQGRIVTGRAWLSGHLRGDRQPFDAVFDARLVTDQRGVVTCAEVRMDDELLGRLRDARRRE